MLVFMKFPLSIATWGFSVLVVFLVSSCGWMLVFMKFPLSIVPWGSLALLVFFVSACVLLGTVNNQKHILKITL